MKRKTGLFLTLLMILVCMAAVAAASGSGSCGENVVWTLDDSGLMTISGRGPMADGAFWTEAAKAEEIREVVIGDGVTRVGAGAFTECGSITKVSLPESVTVLGAHAFDNCNALPSMTLPANVTEIGEDALLMETSVFYAPFDSVTARTMSRQDLFFYVSGENTSYLYLFNSEGEETGLKLYSDETKGKTVRVREGVTEIAPYAFRNCSSAEKIVIPDTVKKLTTDVFARLKRSFYISCSPGSYAESFALEQGLQYDNGVKKVIGYNISDPTEKVNWVVRNYIRSGMSEKKKLKVLHNWLLNNCHYDEAVQVHDMETLLTEGYGVCSAYSDAYQALLARAGMACGKLHSNEMDHVWNVVRMNGKWYHVDVTWDDPTTGPKDTPPISGQEKSQYFLLKDAQMKKDHIWESYLSADRFLIESYYDPDYGRVLDRVSWYYSGVYALDWKNRTASLIYIYDSHEAKSFEVPDHMVNSDENFTVTAIGENAAHGIKELKNLTIGKNVKTIGKDAFRNCSKLKKITLKTEKLTKQSVGASAFKGISKKAVFRCPEGKADAYRKILRKKGVPKTATFK